MYTMLILSPRTYLSELRLHLSLSVYLIVWSSMPCCLFSYAIHNSTLAVGLQVTSLLQWEEIQRQNNTWSALFIASLTTRLSYSSTAKWGHVIMNQLSQWITVSPWMKSWEKKYTQFIIWSMTSSSVWGGL